MVLGKNKKQLSHFTPSDIENVLGNVAFVTDKSPEIWRLK